jgi:hypothetical protein
MKTIITSGFKLSAAGTPITTIADNIRTFTLDRAKGATTEIGLHEILKDTIGSTGIDLNKTPGSKEQTEFAFKYIADVKKIDTMSSDEEANDALFIVEIRPERASALVRNGLGAR